MRGNLGIEMARHRDAGRARDGGRPHPAGYATNTHEVRHNEITCLLAQRLVHLPRTIEILTDLNWRFQLGSQLGVAIEVVIDDRLLDPGEAMTVDHMTARKCLGQIE